jgi:shikimate dehydrogenase
MVGSITKDTVLCMSLAGRPSNIGTRFHNFLYEELGLDFVYKAFTTTDLPAAIAGIRALGIRGCGVSMPYKEACIRHVDAMDASAQAIGSVNTIVNTDGQLRAYNTDYLAIAKLMAARQIPVDAPLPCSGAGAWPRPWWRRCATRASTRGRWSRATRGRGRRWPASTGMPGGPSLVPAGRSCW